jgi:putative aminopeptidase FrvX
METIMRYLEKLLSIDSTTGMFEQKDRYLMDFAKERGIQATALNKGGVRFDFPGEENPVCMSAHADEIGLMVRWINPDGTLRLERIGGLHEFYAIDWNCRVYARNGNIYTGTVRRTNPGVHVMNDSERAELPKYDRNVVLTLDENVSSRAETEALGITVGDYVAPETRFTVTPSGYVKSRYLDDQACVAALLVLADKIADGSVKPKRKVSMLFSEYEEIGHGGSCGIPENTRDFIAFDIGVVGTDHTSSEHKVTIGVKDTSFPYHAVLTNELVQLCRDNGIPFVLDMPVPHYGSDANCALRAGYDVRHALVGPGVLETHGYERTHIDALRATFDLARAIVTGG